MSEEGNQQNTQLKNKFNNKLNYHGYGLQYAVLKAAEEARGSHNSCWVFEAAEFPVEVRNKHTRIDFVLRTNNKRYYLVAECKRVNPAFGNWCFVSAPMVRRHSFVEQYHIEFLKKYRQDESLEVTVRSEAISKDNSFHIGIPVKNDNAKGNPNGKSDEDAIEKAATQVSLGVNGLIQKTHEIGGKSLFTKGFLPVIFTTAKLWACDCDLSVSNLNDGKIDLKESGFQEKPWVFYQYHLTPGIKHPIKSRQSSAELSSVLWFDYIRTIPIVNAKYTNEFLGFLRPDEIIDPATL